MQVSIGCWSAVASVSISARRLSSTVSMECLRLQHALIAMQAESPTHWSPCTKRIANTLESMHKQNRQHTGVHAQAESPIHRRLLSSVYSVPAGQVEGRAFISP